MADYSAEPVDGADVSDAVTAGRFGTGVCEHGRTRSLCWHHQLAAAAARGDLAPPAEVVVAGDGLLLRYG
ncbi:MAG: hypothetical protein M3Q47_08830 [Actinomycetota bacterium]|nr:hypothetical protein [Actinomycetota bacterium]